MDEHVYNSANIKYCNDGKYRWVYELSMYSNSAILKECYRVFFVAVAVIGLIVFFASLGDGFSKALTAAMYAVGITGCIFLVLVLVGYLILAFMYGGKYCVLFEMSEDGVLHAQQEKQVKKAKLLGAITALTGAAGGRIGTVGTGILVGARTQMASKFASIKVIEAVSGSHLIRLNGALDRNQVYAEDEDFGFVLNYIVSHCPNAELKGDYEQYLNNI